MRSHRREDRGAGLGALRMGQGRRAAAHQHAEGVVLEERVGRGLERALQDALDQRVLHGGDAQREVADESEPQRARDQAEQEPTHGQSEVSGPSTAARSSSSMHVGCSGSSKATISGGRVNKHP